MPPVKGYLEVAGSETMSRLEFMYNPREVREEYEVGWTDKKIPGLPLPIKQYVGGGNREISFTLQLAAPVALDPDTQKTMVDDYIESLYGFAMPTVHHAGFFYMYMPPVLKLILGQQVVTGVLTRLGIKRIYFDQEMNTTVAEVDISFQQLFLLNY